MEDEEIMKSNSGEIHESYSDQVKMLFKVFVPTLELLFAKELPEDKRKLILEKLSNLELPSLQYAQQVENIKKNQDMAEFARASNEFIHKLLPESPSSMSGLEHARDILFKTSNVGVAYIRKSKYRDYIKCIQQIISVAMGQGLQKVVSYLSSVDNVSSDNEAWAQSVVTDMGKIVKHLTPDRKRFSRGLALRCVADYGKMSGVYERLVIIMAGFVSIKSDTIEDYGKFRKKGLSHSLKVIRDKSRTIITQDFDILIRNSVAHKSYVLDPSERIVHFSDPISGQAESVSYRSLFEKTRDMSCLVLALSQFKGLVYAAMLTHINSLLVTNNKV